MANFQKCVSGIESANDALGSIINKALGYPKIGTHVGGGVHVPMPLTWDGQGNCPPGWTKQRQANWVASALDSQLPVSDALSAELQLPSNQAKLSAGEIVTLSSALSARAIVDLEAGNYIPKANAAVVAAEEVP